MSAEIFEFKEAKEKIQIRNWKALSPYWKHMVLMYFFRLKTDIEHINDYVEASEFRKLEITPDSFPDFLADMSPHDLRHEAYEVIGKLGELPKEPA